MAMLWVDKHRPKTLEELDYHSGLNERLKRIAGSGEMPHLLICGPSGAGKSTRVHALLNALYGPGVETVKVETKTVAPNPNTPSNTVDIQVLSSTHVHLDQSHASSCGRLLRRSMASISFKCSLCCLAVAGLVGLSAVIWFGFLCQGDECNIVFFWQFLLSPQLPLIHHYRSRSYEDFMFKFTGSGWDRNFQAGEIGIDVGRNETREDLSKKAFRIRDKTGYRDTTALRLVPKLAEISNLSIPKRLSRFHARGHCVMGFAKPNQTECRQFFLVAIVRVVEREEVYIEQWINLHSAVGVDHFVVLSANTTLLHAALQPFVQAEIVDERLFVEGPYKQNAIANLGLSCFWMIFIDLDEYILPPPPHESLKDFLLPLTTVRPDRRSPKQIMVFYKYFGSNGWVKRPKVPDIEAYTDRDRPLQVNGKSLELIDAINVSDPFTGYPHRSSLLQEFRHDSATSILIFNSWILWVDTMWHPVICPRDELTWPAGGDVSLANIVLGICSLAALLCLCSCSRLS
ncbi:rfc5 [Symbiodinium necroappetens]|uniref:Rfc5 protein n=1 Tax=Symbiodinium necroappetens TaxID=1628268 RepID=A0A812M1H7_9DINO|nr:rfc5 [Symbiodinium necroappetens]